MTDDAPTIAAVDWREFTPRAMDGFRIERMAEVSATTEPLRPANSMAATMLVCAKPAPMWPTSTFANLTS